MLPFLVIVVGDGGRQFPTAPLRVINAIALHHSPRRKITAAAAAVTTTRHTLLCSAQLLDDAASVYKMASIAISILGHARHDTPNNQR